MKRIKAILGFMKNHKSEIIVGIIVFVITSISTNFISRLIKAIPSVGSSIAGLIGNIIYSSAAEHNSSTVSINVFIFCLGFLFSVMMVFAYYGYRKSKKMISENAERSSDEGNHVGKKASKERLVGIASYFKRTLVMMVVLTIIAFSMIAATLLIPNAKWSRFMQDMTMITPYTDDQTLSLLRSDWTRMESKEDYQMIYQTINEIKGENGL